MNTKTVLPLDMLLERLYRHYPRGIELDDPRHHTCEESRRLACVYEAAAIACGKGFVPVPDDQRVTIDPEVQQVIQVLHAWKSFHERCQRAFPDREVWDGSGPFHDPGYRISVAQAGFGPFSESQWSASGELLPRSEPIPMHEHDPVVCVVSVLAPVYAILTYVPDKDRGTDVQYSEFPPRYLDRVDPLIDLVEDTFGFSRLTEKVLFTPVTEAVPFMSNKRIGRARLDDCLFSPTLW